MKTAQLLAPLAMLIAAPALAGDPEQAPYDTHVPASHRDRVYAAEQFSNTVSVSDPVDGTMLGVIRLGDPQPQNFSPLYRGQVLVHGIGFAPDGQTLAVVSIGSNSVTFIDTATNTVKHTTYIGRSPHEAFYTPDGREVWVTVRGEDYISVLDPVSYLETARLPTPGGPGMMMFSPDGKYGYVCSSFNPELVVYDVASHEQIGSVEQPSPFCPNIAVTPDGRQVWYTLKDIGKTVVIDALPPFDTITVLDTGPITNHVNIANTREGMMAYVTVGGLNEVKVFRTDDFSQVATIPVGHLPHGVWPSGDGRSVFVGLENDDQLVKIDTDTNQVVATIPIGQAPQAVVYVPNAVPEGISGTDNLAPLGVAGNSTSLILAHGDDDISTVALFDQGLVQVLQGSVTGLMPGQMYELVLVENADGSGAAEPIASFKANPAGGAIVNATGPIRQIVQGDGGTVRRYLAIRDATGTIVQLQR